MYIVRDIFHLRFGSYSEAKDLMNELFTRNMLPPASDVRVLSDFSGGSYRMIMEGGFESLASYEAALTSVWNQPEWKEWYNRFKEFVISSDREILKQINHQW
ncbi:MAG TPA: hypothetical protein PKM63_10780 [Panacibacter sp.]|nr:hypothetical protein [Panacibacter sp.]HNP44763.1 hypothetical protein [Panacibacter sp.]